jgi:hypothetical protein
MQSLILLSCALAGAGAGSGKCQEGAMEPVAGAYTALQANDYNAFQALMTPEGLAAYGTPQQFRDYQTLTSQYQGFKTGENQVVAQENTPQGQYTRTRSEVTAQPVAGGAEQPVMRVETECNKAYDQNAQPKCSIREMSPIAQPTGGYTQPLPPTAAPTPPAYGAPAPGGYPVGGYPAGGYAGGGYAVGGGYPVGYGEAYPGGVYGGGIGFGVGGFGGRHHHRHHEGVFGRFGREGREGRFLGRDRREGVRGGIGGRIGGDIGGHGHLGGDIRGDARGELRGGAGGLGGDIGGHADVGAHGFERGAGGFGAGAGVGGHGHLGLGH